VDQLFALAVHDTDGHLVSVQIDGLARAPRSACGLCRGQILFASSQEAQIRSCIRSWKYNTSYVDTVIGVYSTVIVHSIRGGC
jgi:hypothetical protein